MKKVLLTTILSCSLIFAFAQAPTTDFESWTGNEPTGWISENELMVLLNPQSCFQETVAANVHGGANSMKLLSVTMTNPVAGLPNPIGLAAPGKLVGFAPKFGMAYTGRPATANFWYKYTPAAGDSAEFLVTIWNSTTGDTIAAGYTKLGTASAYTSQSVPLTYNPSFSTEFPDSMGLMFSATKLFNSNYTMCMNCGKAGSTLWIDDVTFTGWNGVNEHLSSEGVLLYPNPASQYVSISATGVSSAALVSVYDVTGRIVSTTPLLVENGVVTKKSATVNTTNLSTGLYSYYILDENGAAIRAGKFNVVR
jgi:hypothetical protein